MPKKILIVDDDPAFTQMLKLRLESEHYAVSIAENGVEGLKTIQAEEPDFIVVDVVMPQMDGYTFVRTLKSKGFVPKIPFLVLSARDATREIFELEGICDFLAKPCNLDHLIRRIKEKIGSE